MHKDILKPQIIQNLENTETIDLLVQLSLGTELIGIFRSKEALRKILGVVENGFNILISEEENVWEVRYPNGNHHRFGVKEVMYLGPPLIISHRTDEQKAKILEAFKVMSN